MMKIEVLNTAAKGKQFTLREGFTIGSGEGCTVRAQHPSLQSVHVRFVNDQGRMVVEVGCTEAHITINGKDVLRHHLRHRDELMIGPLRLRAVDDKQISNASLNLETLLEEVEHGQGGDVYDFAKEDLFYLVSKDPSLRRALNFVIPSKDRFIDQAQVFLGRLVKNLDMEEQQVDAFMTCTKELILNAHRHGHKYDESKRIVLRWRDYGEKVQLTIEDEGPGFDHQAILEKVKQKDAAQAARERYLAGGFGGLGYQLVVRMSETLIYNDKGNVVSFTVMKIKAS